MRIVLNRAACTGHGRCYALAPDVFAPDDDGYCSPILDEVPPHLEEQARLGIDNCPEDALSIEQ